MNILVTLNSNYLKPLKIMLKSMFINNQDEHFTIYLMYSSLKESEIGDLNNFVVSHGHKFNSIVIEDGIFKDAPVTAYFTKEMYYRLLAYKFLPVEVERVLYLDADILVINSMRELYEIDLEGFLCAAACHNIIPFTEVNKLRLNPLDPLTFFKAGGFYNSGVLLMNLKLQRELIDEKVILNFIKKNHFKLIMPDQDIINALYSKTIKSIDETKYNFHVRYYRLYKLNSHGTVDMDYILRNTVFLHFCGRKKPWQKDYSGHFHSLYKHYEKLTFPINSGN